MLPKSPWEESLADKLNDGVPTEDRVADILEAINPLLPTPQSITFDWHLAIWTTVWLNELFIFFKKSSFEYVLIYSNNTWSIFKFYIYYVIRIL